MSTVTGDELLIEQIEGAAATIWKFVSQIESGTEPAITDSYGNVTPIDEYPLEVVDERGREFAVVLCTGGPHIEVVADGLCSARLEGYWAGSRCTRSGDYLSTFLDYFIDRERSE